MELRISLASFAAGIVVALLFAGVIAAAFFIFSTQSPAPTSAAEEEGDVSAQATVSAKISLVEITDPRCAYCGSLSALKDSIRTYDVNLVSEEQIEYGGEQGKAILSAYGLSKVPALLVTGDTANATALLEDWSAIGSVAEDGTLVFQTNAVPFREVQSDRIRGLVGVVLVVDSNCTQCANPLNVPTIQQALSSMAIPTENVGIVEASSDTGRALLGAHYLSFVPALILVGDYQDYAAFQELQTLGSFESDGSFVVRKSFPPFMDVSSGEIQGLLDVTLIQDSRCWACHNARDLLAGLQQNLGLVPSTVNVLEASSREGQDMFHDFKIKFLPAAIIGGNTASHELLNQVWPAVGGRREKGALVLDTNFSLGPGFYVNAETGELATMVQPFNAQNAS